MALERLEELRKLMADRSIDVYVVPTADFHESEYVGGYFAAREFITGFTGSAGIAVITKEDAGLFTDGRYFIQAEKEISGSGFRLFKMGVEGVPSVNEFIEASLPENGMIGFDGRVINGKWGMELEEIAAKKNGGTFVTEDLVGLIWEERPAISCEKAWILPEKYTGESAASKIARVREFMKEQGANVHILTTLDDIAWLLNIRGNDAGHFPVVLSYLLLTAKGCVLYAAKEAFDEELQKYLSDNGVTLADYEDIYGMADKMSERSMGKVLLDTGKVNYRILKAVSKGSEILNKPNPTVKMKAVKNAVEQKNIRRAHIKDGVAMVKWLYWLKNTIGKEELDEISVSDKLEAYRRSIKGFLDLSFDTIAAYEGNAAMMHYSAKPETAAVLEPKGFLLVDSGAHYLEGSTDITRTIALGPVTEEQREMFTAVLRSNMNLSAAKFLYGCTGQNLDILARGPLWDLGIDYRCGTGHGVGYILSIHEPPNGFRWRIVPERNDSSVLEEGMVTTDEPGVYKEGEYGIRTENELLCLKDEQNEYGQFMRFETVTYCPIDLNAVDPEEMTKKEKKLLNDYHEMVYRVISPYLTKEEQLWLRYETRRI